MEWRGVLDDGSGRPAADRESLTRAAIRSWRDSLITVTAMEAVYRDLRDHEDLIAAHPVVKALAAGGPGRAGAGSGPGAEAGPAASLDAGAAPRACASAVLAGRPVLLACPPGPARTEVLARLAAALLADSRTVLAVSGQPATLGALRDRLTGAGLSGYLREVPDGPPEGAGQAGPAASPAAAAVPGPAPALPAGPEPARAGEVPGEVRRAAAALAAAWRPAAEGGSFLWRDVVAQGPLDDQLYQAASALEALGGMVRLNHTLAQASGLTRPSAADALAGLLGHLWSWPDGLPDEWLTVESLDAVDAAAAQLAAVLMAIAAREGQAAQASGLAWQEIPQPAALPAVDSKALAALSPAAADVSDLAPGQINGVARVFATDADLLEKRFGTLSGLASMLGLRPPETFHDAADLLTLARLAQEPDRPERGWLSVPGHQAASRAARALYEAHRALAQAETDAAAVFTPAVLQLDVDSLAERFSGAHRGIGRLSGEYRADRRTLAEVTVEGADLATAQEYFGLAVAWKHAAETLASVENGHAALLGPYYAGPATDFERLSRALANAATAVRCARRQDLTQAADHLCRDAMPKPVITATAAEATKDLSTWQATLAPPPAVAPRPELVNGTIGEAISWLRAHVAPLRAASQFTHEVSEIIGRPLSYGEARQLVGLREAADAAHAELTSRDAVFKQLCGTLYAGTGTDLTALRAALDWARRLRSMVTGGEGPLTPAHVRAAESAVPTTRLIEAAAAWRQACATLLEAFAPDRRAELAAQLDDYTGGVELLEALFNDTTGRDEWRAYQEARATLAAHGLAAAVDRCIAQRADPAQVPQLIEQALRGGGPAVPGGAAPAATPAAPGAAAPAGPAPGTGPADGPCVLATPAAVSRQLPAQPGFDVVIVDEVGPAGLAGLISCLYRGRVIVLAGEHSEPARSGADSLFELARRSGAFQTVTIRQGPPVTAR